MLLYVRVTLTITNRNKKLREELNEKDIELGGIRNESLSNFETVKVFSTEFLMNLHQYFTAEEYEFNRYRTAVDKYQCLERKYHTSYSLLNLVQGVIFTTALAALLFLFAYNVVHDRASAADVGKLISYWLQLQQPLNNLGYSYKGIHDAFIDAERVLKILLEEPSIKDRVDAVDLAVDKGEIKFDHVDFSYNSQSNQLTLADLTFTALPGQTVALVGQSGGGKSTVQRLTFRFYDIESGTISVDGQDIRDVRIRSLRSCIGIVPQVKIFRPV